MSKMTAKAFVDKAVDIAKNYKTLYVMGCFGAPLTGSNVSRYCNNHSYNKNATRTAMIKAAANQSPPVSALTACASSRASSGAGTGTPPGPTAGRATPSTGCRTSALTL